MNIWSWIGIIGIIILTPLSLLKKENRTKDHFQNVIVTLIVAFMMIIAVLIFHVSFLLAFVVGLIIITLFDKKTYTKKRLLIYSLLIVFMIVFGYFLLRDHPNYVLNHIKQNPESTSLYLVENGVEKVAYGADTVRPLASTVKMLIAVEYAIQVDAGKINADKRVPLEELSRYYLKGTDGNAHEEWLNAIEANNKMIDGTIALHEIAKGMIRYSSNANTDYLIDLLTVDAIDERAKALQLKTHEPMYPIVSALLIPTYLQERFDNKKQLIAELESMSANTYRELAIELSKQMKSGFTENDAKSLNLTMAIQRNWSDRLIGASAKDYGKLMAIISNDELPGDANVIVRELLEWPMQLHEENSKNFVHLGAKGGSTAFVLNDALYAEDHDQNKIELVILLDDLNLWQSIRLGIQLNSFEVNLLTSEEYRLNVQNALK